MEILLSRQNQRRPSWEKTPPKWKKKNSSETTVNAAILAGHWATPCDHEETSCIADGTNKYYTDWYGGGLENGGQVFQHAVRLFLDAALDELHGVGIEGDLSRSEDEAAADDGLRVRPDRRRCPIGMYAFTISH